MAVLHQLHCRPSYERLTRQLCFCSGYSCHAWVAALLPRVVAHTGRPHCCHGGCAVVATVDAIKHHHNFWYEVMLEQSFQVRVCSPQLLHATQYLVPCCLIPSAVVGHSVATPDNHGLITLVMGTADCNRLW